MCVELPVKFDGFQPILLRRIPFGVNLLLDVFAKERASLLEVTSGINDSYLVFEWRSQRVDQRDRPWAPAPTKVKGFDFSGSLFTIGLKLDY